MRLSPCLSYGADSSRARRGRWSHIGVVRFCGLTGMTCASEILRPPLSASQLDSMRRLFTFGALRTVDRTRQEAVEEAFSGEG